MASATKTCTGCGRSKAHKYFGMDRSTKDGYRHRCKQCRRPQQAAINQRYYRAHRDELAAQRAADRPLLRAAQQARRRENLEESREYDRWRVAEYRRRRGDEINARRRANYAAKRQRTHAESAA